MEKLTIEKFREKIEKNDYNFLNFEIGREIQDSLYDLNNKEIDFSNSKILNLDFIDINLESSKFINTYFEKVNFKKVNLFNSNFEYSRFENTYFEKCDLSESIFDMSHFIHITEYQEPIYLGFENYFKDCYFEGTRFFSTNIIKSNDFSLKEKGIIYNITSERNYFLQKNSEIEIKNLTESFEKLEKNFKREEIIWISISFILFISLLYFFTIPIFDMFLYSKIYYFIFYGILGILGIIIFIVFIILETFEKIDKNYLEKENINIIEKIKNFFKKEYYSIFKFILFSIFLSLLFFNFNYFLSELKAPEKSLLNFSYYSFIPFGIILTTFLYFSVSQYLKAKKLRIENQNKVALIHGMIGIKADTDKDMDKNIFYQNIANIVFSKVYQGKEDNLPLDKIIELIKIINSNNKN